mgnify:CR=1 FL=1
MHPCCCVQRQGLYHGNKRSQLNQKWALSLSSRFAFWLTQQMELLQRWTAIMWSLSWRFVPLCSRGMMSSPYGIINIIWYVLYDINKLGGSLPYRVRVLCQRLALAQCPLTTMVCGLLVINVQDHKRCKHVAGLCMYLNPMEFQTASNAVKVTLPQKVCFLVLKQILPFHKFLDCLINLECFVGCFHCLDARNTKIIWLHCPSKNQNQSPSKGML